jgi:hypothetical protein
MNTTQTLVGEGSGSGVQRTPKQIRACLFTTNTLLIEKHKCKDKTLDGMMAGAKFTSIMAVDTTSTQRERERERERAVAWHLCLGGRRIEATGRAGREASEWKKNPSHWSVVHLRAWGNQPHQGTEPWIETNRGGGGERSHLGKIWWWGWAAGWPTSLTTSCQEATLVGIFTRSSQLLLSPDDRKQHRTCVVAAREGII